MPCFAVVSPEVRNLKPDTRHRCTDGPCSSACATNFVTKTGRTATFWRFAVAHGAQGGCHVSGRLSRRWRRQRRVAPVSCLRAAILIPNSSRASTCRFFLVCDEMVACWRVHVSPRASNCIRDGLPPPDYLGRLDCIGTKYMSIRCPWTQPQPAAQRSPSPAYHDI